MTGSDGTITALTWDVHGEVGASDAKIRGQLDFLDEHASGVDIFLFQAVNYEQGDGDRWGGQLGAFVEHFDGFEHAERERTGFDCVHTADWARALFESDVQPHQDVTGPHNRCNLTVSRWPIERTPLTLRTHGDRKPRKLTYYTNNFSEKILVSEVDLTGAESLNAEVLDVWNVGVVNGANWGEEKIKMLETVYGRLYLQNDKTDREVVLGGDFNAPKRETAEEVIVHDGAGRRYTNYPRYGDPYYFGESSDSMDEFTFCRRWQRAEANVFDREVGEWDMRDAYWAADESARAPSTADYTHVVHTGTPSRKRLDHLFVSEHFAVNRCEILNGEGDRANGLAVSDHAPVIAEIELRSAG